MTPERWQQVEEVLQGALDRPALERAAYLDHACAGDEELRRETISLIGAHDEAGDFIEEPAMAADAHLLLGDNVGDEVGPYKIINCLGRGGMGEVYLAQDTRLDRPVALKILPAYFAADDLRLHRFQREARAASALNHPSIITIHEVGEHEGVRFIAAEFVDGQLLRELIEQGSLSLEESIDIVSQVAAALSVAHSAGIVHRDIKPENIMRRADGLVKILDFGIAKLVEHESLPVSGSSSETRLQTELGVVMGTVNYMSPEQARALEVDERTDIWSLGVVLFEMLTGRLPFSGATRMDILVSILEREPEPISNKKTGSEITHLQSVVQKALRKDRDERYQTTDEFLTDLKRAQEDASVAPTHSSSTTNTETAPNSRRVFTSILLGTLIIALIVGAVILRKQFKSPSPAEPTVTAAKLYAQMSDAEKLTFVTQQEQRISTMMGDRHVALSDEAVRVIKNYVDRYVAQGNKANDASARLNATYTRAQRHVPLIARSFAARKVPVIIGIYLPVVESAYRDCYESQYGAKGLFQFLPETARLYGVARDEMCDVEKMAPAAAHYIADRMAELGEDSQSLTLVLLSYNRGPESVRDHLRVLRDTPNYQRNFWTLFAHRDKLDDTFRNESAGYVPAFFAAAIIGENPQVFELTVPPLSSLAEDSKQ
ncbi:MAG TPA: serine/threonine-protein kinase [Pyrinomonadaceae bacterium]|nr:serine/threonine-protein kinase [Pyrinomonadaceae bacterium]